MALINCKECGRLFNSVMRDICPDCMRKDDMDFLKVSGFLREHRGASPDEVHEETEVALDKIYRFIRDGRLIASNFPGMTYPCERCGNPIQAGRFCRTCTNEIQQGFNKLIHDAPAEDNNPKPKTGNDFHLKNRFERK